MILWVYIIYVLGHSLQASSVQSEEESVYMCTESNEMTIAAIFYTRNSFAYNPCFTFLRSNVYKSAIAEVAIENNFRTIASIYNLTIDSNYRNPNFGQCIGGLTNFRLAQHVYLAIHIAF